MFRVFWAFILYFPRKIEKMPKLAKFGVDIGSDIGSDEKRLDIEALVSYMCIHLGCNGIPFQKCLAGPGHMSFKGPSYLPPDHPEDMQLGDSIFAVVLKHMAQAILSELKARNGTTQTKTYLA